MVANTLVLALAAATTSTLLGFGLALAAERTRLGRWKAVGLLAVLPVVTPPFVVGLAIILLFGRFGAVTQALEWAFAIPATRWIYGWPGLLLAQTMAFTPVAFLMLRGTLQGIAPSIEQAAGTLRAPPGRVFRRVTLPLCAPGLANAFLLAMVESMADFGNPALLGGQIEVLSTQIYFALVGAQQDAGRAAALGLLLLAMTATVFILQTVGLARAHYTTIAGKADGALTTALPTGLARGVTGLTLGWLALTVAVYGTVLAAGFVKQVGLDHTPTLQHLTDAFGLEHGEFGLVWSGAAWKPLFTTLWAAGLAAPFTAAGGLALAWLIERRRFAGRRLLEFTVLLTFAIPGTVVGLAYIGAFNLPPIELTGTLGVLIACFIFRDLPVAMRAGSAALAQVDASLEEAAATLRHAPWPALRRALLPLLKPALVVALVVSLVRAATSLSPVVFLATPEFTPVTVWVIERAESAQYGLAIIASAALVAAMGLSIALIQRLVGERAIRRSTQALSS
ncbi:MAG: iron ABC transporter permease [Burkholderiales bacterium]|nr:iron ABC transporter permease [Burkholderiales bacterium]